MWAIEKNGKLVGGCSIHVNAYNDFVEIGYEIAKDYWNQGIASAVVKSLLKFSFESLQANRVESICWDNNIGSARAMEKAGMVHEGTLKQRVKYPDKDFRDQLYYAMLKTDYFSSSALKETKNL